MNRRQAPKVGLLEVKRQHKETVSANTQQFLKKKKKRKKSTKLCFSYWLKK